MRAKTLLTISAILLFAGARAAAQAPAAPPTPAPAPMPGPAPEPMSFSFLFEGSNYLGVVPEDINRENMSQYGLSSPRGVGVSRVIEGSPAEKAGLRKGDVILQFDGEMVATVRKLQRLIGEAAPEQNVRLTVSRNGSEQHLNVTLGKREGAFGSNWKLQTPRHPAMPGTPPIAPRVWGWGGGDAPEVFSYGFGSNRRVGVTTNALTKQLAEFFGVPGGRGLLITSVSENSPASKAGLRAGDVITEANGEKVEDMGDFLRVLNKGEGDVNLTIIRDKSQRTIRVTPEKRQGQTFNIPELNAVIRGVATPRALMNMPDMRVLRSLPSVQTFSLPRIETMITPRVITPRVVTPRINVPVVIAPDME